MRIDRVFTEEHQDPYEGLRFVERISKINNADGSLVAEIKNVLVPDFWSQVAVDIMAQKYFRKAGVPARLKKKYEPGMPEWLCPSVPDAEELGKLPESAQFSREATSQEVFHRLAGCWTYWGWKNNCFASEEDARSYYDEMRYMLSRQLAAKTLLSGLILVSTGHMDWRAQLKGIISTTQKSKLCKNLKTLMSVRNRTLVLFSR